MASRTALRQHAILVGTDFSAASRVAEARAAELAQRLRATLHVVHAASRLPPALARRFSSLTEGAPQEALHARVEALRNAGIDARGHLMHGDPIKALTTKARAVATDLIVVGTRGGNVLEAMVGSTAERLIAADQHRVLLARRKTKGDYRKVVVAANEESRLREQVAAATFVCARPPTVLHAYEAPFESALIAHGAKHSELGRYTADAKREAERTMTRLMEKAGLAPAQLVLQHGSPLQLLQRFDPASLIVLSRGRSRARHIIFGSVTRAVVAHGHSDVLLV